ncbi:centrosomal protein 43 [Parasteatoda tepidariorum]|uniref:centrosomal protein 43 n=1 Tax=Parasteatoda tepidariorum TaxID=114398 RepID=UPI00077FB07C|nr:centrosomal protein 43 [Parasteatoda tepidariorum]
MQIPIETIIFRKDLSKAIMFAEGELRDLVVQNLESCGFLNKIKAELRAGVFLALSEEESFKKKIPLFNKQLENFLNTDEGKLAVSVVREFLEYFNLSFTLSVFDPEVSSSTASRKSLCEDLNLKETEFDGPILSALLKTHGSSKFVSSKNNEDNVKKFQDLMDKSSVSDKLNEKNTLNSFQKSTKQTKDISLESSETNKNSNTSFSVNNVGNNRNFFDFSKPEEKDIFKDQSIDNFFDDPVPSEKSNIFMGSSLKEPKSLSSTLLASEKESLSALSKQKILSSTFFTSEKGSALNDEIKVSSFLTSEKDSVLQDQKRISSTLSLSDKGSLSSLRDLPSLMKQDKSKNKELQEITDIGHVDKDDFAKKDIDPESSEEIDRQMNSEESIEEEIEEEFSAGLDDLLNSSLSLGDDATSDQTVSQASVVDGVDHIETCNTVN